MIAIRCPTGEVANDNDAKCFDCGLEGVVVTTGVKNNDGSDHFDIAFTDPDTGEDWRT